MSKRPPGFTEEIEARAVIAAEDAVDLYFKPNAIIVAAAPVIAEAGYRAGIAEVLKAVEAEADRYGKQAQMLNSPDSEEAEAVLRDMLSKLRSDAALTGGEEDA